MNEQATDNDDDLKIYGVYIAERNRLISAKQEQSRSFDQTILTLAAGAIGLSITFLEKIAPEPTHKLLMYFSWTFFGLAVLSTLMSFLSSQRGAEFEIKRIDEWYRERKQPEGRSNTAAIWTRWLNRCSVGFFFVGVMLFGVFAGFNWIGREKAMTEKKAEKTNGRVELRENENLFKGGYTPDSPALPANMERLPKGIPQTTETAPSPTTPPAPTKDK